MTRDIPILVVEDDAIDIKNIKRAFIENHVINPLIFVTDGEQALSYLRNESPFDDAVRYPRPGVIMLDLNMPRMNGLDFLREYKNDPNLKAIPTVIMTTSDEPSDRATSYELGVAGYIVKPVMFSNFLDVIKRFDLYWTLCEVPTR